jgi:hypothetical protein
MMWLLSLMRQYWYVTLAVLGFMLLLVGAWAALHLPGHLHWANLVAVPPQRITLRELAQNGPGNNPHVIVTDFVRGKACAFIRDHQRDEPPPGPDEPCAGQLLVPLFEATSRAAPPDRPQPRSFVVLLETPHSFQGTTRERYVLSGSPTKQGLALPLASRKLPSSVGDELLQAYPDTDLSECLILVEHDSWNVQNSWRTTTVILVGIAIGLFVGLPLLIYGLIVIRRTIK